MAKTDKTQSKGINKLLNIFGLALKDNGTNDVKYVVPGKPEKQQTKNKSDNDYATTPVEFPSDVQKALDYFMANLDMSSNSERFNRYQSLLFMCRSSGLMASAAQIYTEESFEAKDGVRPVQIKAKDKNIEKAFYHWLDSIGFNNNILRELSWNLTVFGDAFWINSIDLEKGVIGISVLDPFLVKDKLEFSLNSLGQNRGWKATATNLVNRFQSLKNIAKMLDNESLEDDYSLYYQSYLLGYEIRTSIAQDTDTKALPPWAITHFRHFSTQSEFFPFGRPLFINSLARFKSYMTTEMLIDMLRVASFPKEKITVKGGETLSPLDRRIKLNEAKQMIENMCPKTNSKDNLSIGDRIYDMDDLYEYEILDPGIDIDQLGDLTMKLDDLILSTGIPDSYLIPSRGSGMGGESAAALFYNNKIFQRRVIGNKSALLEGITHTFRMHLELTNTQDGEETEFELFMPVNADMYSNDKTSFESDMLKLAVEMMDGLGQALGLERGQSLPEPVVRDIFKHYLPIDDEVVDRWISKIVKKTEDEPGVDNNTEPNATQKEPAPFIIHSESTEKVNKFVESYNKGYQDDMLRKLYFATKNRLGITNGLIGNNIFYNDSTRVKENKSKPGSEHSIYSLLRSQKIDRKLKEKTKNNKK